MEIKIWDTHNKQWLEPMTLSYGKNNNIVKITACIVGSDPIVDGWYNIENKDLQKIVMLKSSGLKIKGGVLFEGDTFKYKSHSGYLLDSFEGVVVWNTEYACFGYNKGDNFTPFSRHDELKIDFLKHCKKTGSIIK